MSPTAPYNRGLVYHKVSPAFEWGLTTTKPDQFKAQMSEIRQLGLSFARLRDHDRIENPVYVTFDDAYDSLHEHALPLMIELNAVATLYVIVDYVGKANSWDYFPERHQVRHLDWSQLQDFVNAGWEIGSHALTHRNLCSLPQRERLSEIQTSRKMLEDRLGIEVTSFCPPYNIWSHDVLEEITAAGYTSMSISFPLTPQPEWNGFILPRQGVYRHDGLSLFRSKLFPTPLTPLSVLLQQLINIGGQGPNSGARLTGR